MQALARSDDDAHLDELLGGLHDPSPRVARAAARTLADRTNERVVASVMATLSADDSDRSSWVAAQLVARRLSRWPQLRVGLSCLGAHGTGARSMGLELVRAAVGAWNDSATSPTAMERAAIASSLGAASVRLPTQLREQLVFLLEADGIQPG